jgi:hypothetical protein
MTLARTEAKEIGRKQQSIRWRLGYFAGYLFGKVCGSSRILKCPHCNAALIMESMTLLSSFQCSRCYSNLRIEKKYAIGAKVLAVTASLAICILSRSTNPLFLILLFLVADIVLTCPTGLFLTAIFLPRAYDEEPPDKLF